MARTLTEAFAARQVHKEYLALVRGWAPEEGLIDYPLKEQLDKIADAFSDPDRPAQEAVTAFRRLHQVELPFAVSKKHPTSRYSLVRLFPKTGRKHQLPAIWITCSTPSSVIPPTGMAGTTASFASTTGATACC